MHVSDIIYVASFNINRLPMYSCISGRICDKNCEVKMEGGDSNYTRVNIKIFFS